MEFRKNGAIKTSLEITLIRIFLISSNLKKAKIPLNKRKDSCFSISQMTKIMAHLNYSSNLSKNQTQRRSPKDFHGLENFST